MKKKVKPTKAYTFCVEMIIKATQKLIKKPDLCNETFYEKVYDKLEKMVPKMSSHEREVVAKLIMGL
jgi:hypothetical protein